MFNSLIQIGDTNYIHIHEYIENGTDCLDCNSFMCNCLFRNETCPKNIGKEHKYLMHIYSKNDDVISLIVPPFILDKEELKQWLMNNDIDIGKDIDIFDKMD